MFEKLGVRFSGNRLRWRFILCTVMLVAVLAGCGNNSSRTISVISRENGSGTRSAFVSLVGLIKENENGEKEDMTVSSAQIINSTGTVITTVEGNPSAVGYISLGSLNSKVKSLAIDGVLPTSENVSSGKYPIARNFNIAILEGRSSDNSALVDDFISFILSNEGQNVVTEFGVATVGAKGEFTSTGASGTIKIGGSSSVKPVMEKLREAYIELNPNATVEVSQSDSTSGVNSTLDGTIDIGMVSREVKDTELAKCIKSIPIAVDGIAVVVSNENTVSDMTLEQVRKVFSGEITKWEELTAN